MMAFSEFFFQVSSYSECSPIGHIPILRLATWAPQHGEGGSVTIPSTAGNEESTSWSAGGWSAMPFQHVEKHVEIRKRNDGKPVVLICEKGG